MAFYCIIRCRKMSDDSKQFKAMFARIPKNDHGTATVENIYVAFRNIIGIDLLTPERFEEAKQKRFKETKEFNYEDCAELFKDIDVYLENLSVELPSRSRSLSNSFRKAFQRISNRKEKEVRPRPSLIEDLPPVIPGPKTPPLSGRVKCLESKVEKLESEISQILEAQKFLLSKVK